MMACLLSCTEAQEVQHVTCQIPRVRAVTIVLRIMGSRWTPLGGPGACAMPSPGEGKDAPGSRGHRSGFAGRSQWKATSAGRPTCMAVEAATLLTQKWRDSAMVITGLRV